MSDPTPEPSGNPLAGKVGLFKKAKPIYWVVAVIVVGGAYLLYRYKKAHAVAAGAPVLATGGDPSTAAGYSSTADYTGSGQGTNPQSATATNAQWVSTAVNGLSVSGKWSALDISNTLEAYSAGTLGNPTQQQADIISAAISLYGNPPEGASPTGPTQNNPTSPTVSSAAFVKFVRAPNGEISALYSNNTIEPVRSFADLAGATWTQVDQSTYDSYLRGSFFDPVGQGTSTTGSAQGHQYTTVAGDTLNGIATRFYGVASTAGILAANPTLPRSGALPAGTVITIP